MERYYDNRDDEPEPYYDSYNEGEEDEDLDDESMAYLDQQGIVDIMNAELAQTELGVPAGTVPEDSEGDLFIHLRCAVCGKEKLLVQSPEE